MSTSPVSPPPAPPVDPLAAMHARLVAEGEIQLGLPGAAPPPAVPEWARWLGRNLKPMIEWLSHQGPAFRILFWVAIAAVVIFVLYLLWKRFGPLLRARRGAAETGADPGWRPERAAARRLLDEADGLAADGHFGEAAHLLLLRSIEQIAARRPGAVRPALTSRELAVAPVLPGDVARAFASIARAVETSWFGAAPFAADAWARCRAAYEDVALPRAWSGGVS